MTDKKLPENNRTSAKESNPKSTITPRNRTHATPQNITPLSTNYLPHKNIKKYGYNQNSKEFFHAMTNKQH